MIYFELKELLDKRHLTMTELSERTGISRTTLSQLSTGKSQGIKFSTLDKLAYALNLNDHAVSKLFKFVPDNTDVTPHSVISFPKVDDVFSAYTLYKKEAYGTTYFAATYSTFKKVGNFIKYTNSVVSDMTVSTLFASSPDTPNTPPAFIENLNFNSEILSKDELLTLEELKNKYFNQAKLIIDKTNTTFNNCKNIVFEMPIRLNQLAKANRSYLSKESIENYDIIQNWNSEQPIPYNATAYFFWDIADNKLLKNSDGAISISITSKQEGLNLGSATFINI